MQPSATPQPPVSPLVSVVTPAFDAAATLPACLASVAAQSFEGWEHIVVDDGSRDATGAILAEAAAREGRLRVLSSPVNRGAAAARNMALAAARGRFVAFLDADDLWLPAKLDAQLAAMREAGNGFSYGAYYVCAGESEAPRRFFRPPPRLAYADLLRGCAIGCSTVMVDREAAGPFAMPAIRRGQDWALWLVLARRGLSFRSFPGVHTVYAERRGSLSSSKLRKMGDVMRVYRASEGLSASRSAALLARHALYVAWTKRRGFHAVEAEAEA